MSNKLLYGLLGLLGVGAIGSVVYNNSLNDQEEETHTEEADQKTEKQVGGDSFSTIEESTSSEVDAEEDSFSPPDIDLSEIFQIQFEDPDHVISKKERKSKLLKTSSSLYSVLTVYRNKLLSAYGENVSEQRMDFHVELVKRSETWTEDKLLDRTQELEGRCIDLADTDVWNIGRHSVTIKTGRVMGYGNTHITLAYFKEGVPADVEDVLFEMDDDETNEDDQTEFDETNDHKNEGGDEESTFLTL